MSLTQIVKIGNHIISLPKFILDFGDEHHHTYNGLLNRHIAVEKLLYKIQDRLMDNDAMPGYRFLRAFLTIFFGLNCNFPKKNIILYATWILRPAHYGVNAQ